MFASVKERERTLRLSISLSLSFNIHSRSIVGRRSLALSLSRSILGIESGKTRHSHCSACTYVCFSAAAIVLALISLVLPCSDFLSPAFPLGRVSLSLSLSLTFSLSRTHTHTHSQTFGCRRYRRERKRVSELLVKTGRDLL